MFVNLINLKATKLSIITILGILFGSSGIAKSTEIFNKTISYEELLKAQETWCSALVSISDTYHTKGYKEAKKLASEVIDVAYGYDIGPVAFNPTWTHGNKNFRTTKRGALSYFVGGDKKFRQDPGFAIGSDQRERSKWVNCKPENSVVQLLGGTANSMGNVIITAENGYTSVVDKTWTFMKVSNGQIKIILHESATPYK